MIERVWFVVRVIVYWALVITAASFGRMAVFGYDEPVFNQTDQFAHSSVWLVPLVYFLAAAFISLPALFICIVIGLAVGPARLIRYPTTLIIGPPLVCVLGYVGTMLLESSGAYQERNASPIDLVVVCEIAGYGLACTLLGVLAERLVARHGWGLGLYRTRRTPV